MVRLRGLKWCPVSTSPVLVEPFHLGRLPMVDAGRGRRFPTGVTEPSRDGGIVESLDEIGFRGSWAAGGSDDCLRLAG